MLYEVTSHQGGGGGMQIGMPLDCQNELSLWHLSSVCGTQPTSITMYYNIVTYMY